MVCTVASTEALGITVSDFNRHDPELLTSPSYMSGGDILIKIAVQNRRVRIGIPMARETREPGRIQDRSKDRRLRQVNCLPNLA